MLQGNLVLPFLVKPAAAFWVGCPQVVEIPVKVVPVVLDTGTEAMGLGEINVPLPVKGERRRGLELVALEGRLDLKIALRGNGDPWERACRDEAFDEGLAIAGGSGEFDVRMVGQGELVCGDEAPLTVGLVHHADPGFFFLQAGYVPAHRLETHGAVSACLQNHLVANE